MGARMNHTRRKERSTRLFHRGGALLTRALLAMEVKGRKCRRQTLTKARALLPGKRLSSASPVIRKAPSKESLIGGKVNMGWE